MMKKMSSHTKNNRKLMVTAICVATLGAQLVPVMNVQAATDSGSIATGTTTDASSSTSSVASQSNSSAGLKGSSSAGSGSDTSTSTGSANTGSESGSESGTGTDTSESDTSSDAAGSTLTGSDSKNEDTTTSNDGTDTTTADTEVAAPVIVDNPDATKTIQEAGYATDNTKVHVEGHIEVSNESGTADTKDTSIFKGSSIIESNDNNKLTAVFTYTDDVPTAKNQSQTLINPTFYLPAYFATSGTAANIVIDQGTSSDAADWQTTLLKNAGLPDSTVIKYATEKYSDNSMTNVNYATLAVLGSDLDVSKITAIQINYDSIGGGNYNWMPANTTYTVSVPLKVVSNDPNNANVSQIGIADNGYVPLIQSTLLGKTNFYTSNSYRTTSFRIADKLTSDLSGQLLAVTEQKSNSNYEAANSDIQELMPSIGSGDISYQNFADGPLTDYSNSYTGSTVVVNNQILEKVAQAVNDKGYSLLLNNDGTIGDGNYIYSSDPTTGNGSLVISANPDATGSTGTTEIAPYVYITLRQLLDTKDSDMTVGDSWDAANGLAEVTKVQDKATPATTADLTTDPTAANHVTTTISDPDGILDKDGKAIKSGSFQVTYSMQDGNYTISKTATVTVKAGSTTGNNSGSTTNNNGGSTTTDNGNDDSNTSTGTGTETTDPDTPVVSPNEVPDEVPVVSPNEIPDISELTGNNSSENSVTDNNVTTNTDESVATGDNVVSTTATKTSNSQTPIYTVGTVQNNASGTLTGYTPTTQTLSKGQTSTTAATFPQTGNANDSKLQVIGAMIVSMMATLAGFAFGKKRHAEKA